MSKWTKHSAEKIGLNTKKFKLTNHSHRSSAISALAKQGVGEQEMIKLTGHSNASSLKPYLLLDPEHHLKLIKNLRENAPKPTDFISTSVVPPQVQVQTQHNAVVEKNNAQTFNYYNCNFYIN